MQCDCLFLSFFTFVLYIFVLNIRINAGYIVAYCYRVFLYADMDVSVERASTFRFEGSGSYVSVKLVIILALSWTRFFNFEHGGSIFIYGIQKSNKF